MKASVWILMLLGLSFELIAQGPPATPVVVTKVIKESVVQHTKVSGRVVAKEMSALSPQVSGHVIKLHKDEGNWVKKGDVLLNLDPKVTELKVAELKNRSIMVEASLKRSRELRRIQKLEWEDLSKAAKSLKGSVSQKELRAEESKVIQLEGEVEQLEAELKVLKSQLAQQTLNLSYHTLKAPFDGQILERGVALGHWLQQGQMAFRISNPQKVDVELDLPDHLFFGLSKEMKSMSVYTSGQEKEIALVDMKIKREVDSKSKTFIWSGVPKQSELVVHGMSVEAQVPTSKEIQALMVNYNAILKNDAGPYVYKVVPGQAGEMVVPIPVKLGFRKAEMVVVNSPALQENDRVVSEGGSRLFPMTPVQAKEAVK